MLLLCPPSCSLKESRALSPPRHSKACVKSRHHREHFLQHIKIDTLVYGNVLCLALKGLFAERPAVEAHIVEVCPFVIDDVKAVGTCFVPCKLIRKPLPISMKSRLPVMAVKRFPPICCNIVLAIISFVFRVLSIGGADTASRSKFSHFGNGGLPL